jgi:hypothetical protein
MIEISNSQLKKIKDKYGLVFKKEYFKDISIEDFLIKNNIAKSIDFFDIYTNKDNIIIKSKKEFLKSINLFSFAYQNKKKGKTFMLLFDYIECLEMKCDFVINQKS